MSFLCDWLFPPTPRTLPTLVLHFSFLQDLNLLAFPTQKKKKKKKKKYVTAYSLILFWKKKSKLYPCILSPCFEIIREAVIFWGISFYYLIQKTNSFEEVLSSYSPYPKHRKMKYLLKSPRGVTKYEAEYRQYDQRSYVVTQLHTVMTNNKDTS